MENLKNQLISTSFKNNVFSHNMLRSKSNKFLRQRIKEKTSFLPETCSDSQRAWHIFNSIYTFPICIGGNERKSFHSFEYGYNKTCILPRFQCICWNDAKESSSTTMKKTNDSGKIKKAIQNKYGVDHVMQIPEVTKKVQIIKKRNR